MAAITFPALSSTRFSLGLDVGNIDLETLSGHVETLNRFPGVWRGTFSFPSTANVAEASEVETFLSAMSDGRNTSEVPLERPTLLIDPGVTIASGPALGAGRLQYTLSGAVAAITPGLYLRISDRLYLVESVNGAVVVILPQVAGIAASSPVRRATTLKIRRDPKSPFSPSPRNPDFSGPWVFAFQEAL